MEHAEAWGSGEQDLPGPTATTNQQVIEAPKQNTGVVPVWVKIGSRMGWWTQIGPGLKVWTHCSSFFQESQGARRKDVDDSSHARLQLIYSHLANATMQE